MSAKTFPGHKLRSTSAKILSKRKLGNILFILKKKLEDPTLLQIWKKLLPHRFDSSKLVSEAFSQWRKTFGSPPLVSAYHADIVSKAILRRNNGYLRKTFFASRLISKPVRRTILKISKQNEIDSDIASRHEVRRNFCLLHWTFRAWKTCCASTSLPPPESAIPYTAPDPLLKLSRRCRALSTQEPDFDASFTNLQADHMICEDSDAYTKTEILRAYVVLHQ